MESIDALRGIVMAIMAIDHVRDMVHAGAMTDSPTNLATTTVPLFLTRWITHFVAPTFMFAAGLGAFLWWQRGKTKRELTTFLVTRGVWLALLEVTVMRLAYNFDVALSYPWFLLVFWVLGLAMIVLGALIWLPRGVVIALSVAMILGHNAFDGVQAASFGGAAWLWHVLHQPGAIPAGGTFLFVAYPLIPWLGVMALGFYAGELFRMEAERRQRILMRLGLAMTLAFVLLRLVNVYGDPVPWQPQPSGLMTTLLSFLNVTKYPPSLSFLLMTLGPALMLLAWLDRRGIARTNPFVVLGRVPLFFFITHFFAAHVAAALISLASEGTRAFTFIFSPVPSMGGPRELYPDRFGISLTGTYLVWLAVILALYPACKWFAGVKARRKEWWLSYL